MPMKHSLAILSFLFLIIFMFPATAQETAKANKGEGVLQFLTYIIHSGFISGYQNRYGDNLKPPTNVYHRMTA